MKDDWVICFKCHEHRRQRDMLGDICIPCRTEQTDQKAVSFTSLNAVFFRTATKPKAKRSSAATY